MRSRNFFYFISIFQLLSIFGLRAAEQEQKNTQISDALVKLTWTGQVPENLGQLLGQDINHKRALEIAIQNWQVLSNNHVNNSTYDYKSRRTYLDYQILAIAQYFYNSYPDISKNSKLGYQVPNGNKGYYQDLLTKAMVDRDSLIAQIWKSKNHLSEYQQNKIQQYQLSSALAQIVLEELDKNQKNNSRTLCYSAWQLLTNLNIEVSTRYFLQAQLVYEHEFNPNNWKRGELLKFANDCLNQALQTKPSSEIFPTFFQVTKRNQRFSEKISLLKDKILAEIKLLTQIQDAYNFVDRVDTKDKTDNDAQQIAIQLDETAQFLLEKMSNYPKEERNRLKCPYFDHARYYLWAIIHLDSLGKLPSNHQHIENFHNVHFQLDLSLKNLKELGVFYSFDVLKPYWLVLVRSGTIFANKQIESFFNQDTIVSHFNIALERYKDLKSTSNITKAYNYWPLPIVRYVASQSWGNDIITLPEELVSKELAQNHFKEINENARRNPSRKGSGGRSSGKGKNRLIPRSEMLSSKEGKRMKLFWQQEVARQAIKAPAVSFSQELVSLSPPTTPSANLILQNSPSTQDYCESQAMDIDEDHEPKNPSFLTELNAWKVGATLNLSDNKPLDEDIEMRDSEEGVIKEDVDMSVNEDLLESALSIIQSAIHGQTGLEVIDQIKAHEHGKTWLDDELLNLQELYQAFMQPRIYFMQVNNQRYWVYPEGDDEAYKILQVRKHLAKIFGVSLQTIGQKIKELTM